MVPVKSITRECQYVWNGEYGRVRCGRLAISYVIDVIMPQSKPHDCSTVDKPKYVRHISFRCSEHERMAQRGTGIRLSPRYDIEENTTFGLGYKP